MPHLLFIFKGNYKMGYSVFLLRAEFFISEENHHRALEAIKHVMLTSKRAQGRKILFAFVNKQSCLQAETLDEAMQAWRWSPIYDDGENIISVEFLGEKIGDDDVFFASLAPFVANGNSIEMAGEDGRVWRWLFRNGAVQKEEGRIIYSAAH